MDQKHIYIPSFIDLNTHFGIDKPKKKLDHLNIMLVEQVTIGTIILDLNSQL